ncbi:UNVERIFIED_CONTAM: hypothetical protein GTU68_012252 [Idotea baltica]|nr:hypothetical protein [Idotea baltica]
MLFTQLEFPIFFAIILIAAWLSRGRTLRNTLLLVASYYFYAYWDYRFCVLLMLSTAVDFVVAKQIHRSENEVFRRRMLLISLVINPARPLLQACGLSGETLGIILPVGISFFTFQTLSYTIDVYRRKLTPTNSLLDFALFVAFFPQLVAGPIVRARELLPQLAAVPKFSRRRMYGGAQQMLRGAAKKILIADRLGEMVDVVFAGPELYSGLTIWIAVIAYAGQIYYDFAGYSDIAIGAAKMLGYRFPANFRHPYLATSMADFWHRWHMTLSRWLRDYVYVSLGGNRNGHWQTYRNLLLTMTLGGLWHGAAWTFLLWGLWHGIALAIEKAGATAKRMPRLLGWVMTMFIVLVGWILFRCAGDLPQATAMIQQMVTFSKGIAWYPPLAIGAIAVMVLEHLAWRTPLRKAMRLPSDRWYSPIATTILLWALVVYAPQQFSPFVYFQF